MDSGLLTPSSLRSVSPPSSVISTSSSSSVTSVYTHNGTVISLALKGQELRDIYFELSGKSDKIGSKHSHGFGTKEALVTEIKRLLHIQQAILDHEERVRLDAIAEQKRIERAQKKAIKDAKITQYKEFLSSLSPDDKKLFKKVLLDTQF